MSTFILGVGAQKAGTTWLHQYLTQRADVFMPPIKELHFFDVLFRPDSGNFNQKFLAEMREAAAKPQVNYRKVIYLAERLAMRNVADYVDYFRRHVEPHHKAYGEITPAYGLLGADGFEAMRSVHDNVKVIFIMRDPISRLVSALGMNNRQQTSFTAIDIKRAVKHRPTIERGNYPAMIETMLSIFPEEDVLFEFYEDLFNDQALARICDHLGLPFQAAEYGKKTHAAPHKATLDEEGRAMAREKFDEVYRYCRERFGARVPQSWA